MPRKKSAPEKVINAEQVNADAAAQEKKERQIRHLIEEFSKIDESKLKEMLEDQEVKGANKWFKNNFQPLVETFAAFNNSEYEVATGDVYNLVLACLEFNKDFMQKFFADFMLQLLVSKAAAEYQKQKENKQSSENRVEESFNDDSYKVRCCFTNEVIPKLAERKERWKMCNNHLFIQRNDSDYLMEYGNYIFTSAETISKDNFYHYKNHWFAKYSGFNGLTFDQATFCFSVLSQIETSEKIFLDLKALTRKDNPEFKVLNKKLEIFVNQCKKLPAWEALDSTFVEPSPALEPHISMWVWLCSQKRFMSSVLRGIKPIHEVEGYDKVFTSEAQVPKTQYKVTLYVDDKLSLDIEISPDMTYATLWQTIEISLKIWIKTMCERLQEVLSRAVNDEETSEAEEEEIRRLFGSLGSFEAMISNYKTNPVRYPQIAAKKFEKYWNKKIHGKEGNDKKEIYVVQNSESYYRIDPQNALPNLEGQTLVLKEKNYADFAIESVIDAPNSGLFNESQSLYSPDRGFLQSAHPIQLEPDKWKHYCDTLRNTGEFATYIRTKKMFPLHMAYFWMNKNDSTRHDIELRIPTVLIAGKDNLYDIENPETTYRCYPEIEILPPLPKDSENEDKNLKLKRSIESVFLTFRNIATFMKTQKTEDIVLFYTRMETVYDWLTEHQNVKWSDLDDKQQISLITQLENIQNFLPRSELEDDDVFESLDVRTTDLLDKLPTCLPLLKMLEHPQFMSGYKHILIKDGPSQRYMFCFNVDTFASFQMSYHNYEFEIVNVDEDWLNIFSTFEGEQQKFYTRNSENQYVQWQRLPAADTAISNLTGNEQDTMEDDKVDQRYKMRLWFVINGKKNYEKMLAAKLKNPSMPMNEESPLVKALKLSIEDEWIDDTIIDAFLTKTKDDSPTELKFKKQIDQAMALDLQDSLLIQPRNTLDQRTYLFVCKPVKRVLMQHTVFAKRTGEQDPELYHALKQSGT